MENLKYLKDILALEKVIAGLKSSNDEELKRLNFLNSQLTKKEDLITQVKDSASLVKSNVNEDEKQLFEVDKKLEQATFQLEQATSDTQVTSLETNIEALKKESDSLQDKILSQFESIERSNEEIAAAHEFIDGIKETIAEIQLEVSQIKDSNSSKIASLQTQIDGLLSEVPPAAANLYNKAKEKHINDPATFIIGTSCGSCKLTYAPAECEKFNKGLDMILCKGCGRLLLPSNLRTL